MENNLTENQNGNLLSKTETKFELTDVALACVMFIAFNILFSILLRISGITLVSGSIVYYILHCLLEGVFALAAFVVAKIRKRNLIEDAGMVQKVNWQLVGWCFLASIVSLIGFGRLTNVFIEILQYFGYSSILSGMEINNFWQYLATIISSCAVAAFCEELLFRGVITSGLKKFGIKTAVGFSALIFMLMHGNAEQTVHQFIVGVIVGYVFYKTNNLWLGVLIHAFNNFIPVTLTYLMNATETAETVETVATTTIDLGTILIDLIVALVVAWAGLYFIRMILAKILKENSKLNGLEETNETVTSIKVDGDETSVEMSIDGDVVENPDETLSQIKAEAEKPVVSGGTILMFVIAGLYLVGTWLLNTIAGFII